MQCDVSFLRFLWHCYVTFFICLQCSVAFSLFPLHCSNVEMQRLHIHQMQRCIFMKSCIATHTFFKKANIIQSPLSPTSRAPTRYPRPATCCPPSPRAPAGLLAPWSIRHVLTCTPKIHSHKIQNRISPLKSSTVTNSTKTHPNQKNHSRTRTHLDATARTYIRCFVWTAASSWKERPLVLSLAKSDGWGSTSESRQQQTKKQQRPHPIATYYTREDKGYIPGAPSMVGALIFGVGCDDSHHKVNNQHKPRRTKTRTRQKTTAPLAKARLYSHNERAGLCVAVQFLWAVTIGWVSRTRGRKQLHTHSLYPNRTKTKKNRATQTYIRFGVIQATNGGCGGPLLSALLQWGSRRTRQRACTTTLSLQRKGKLPRKEPNNAHSRKG